MFNEIENQGLTASFYVLQFREFHSSQNFQTFLSRESFFVNLVDFVKICLIGVYVYPGHLALSILTIYIVYLG